MRITNLNDFSQKLLVKHAVFLLRICVKFDSASNGTIFRVIAPLDLNPNPNQTLSIIFLTRFTQSTQVKTSFINYEREFDS